MPKPSKRSNKGSSNRAKKKAGVKQKSKFAKIGRTSKRPAKRVIVVDTLQSWIDREARKKRSIREESKSKELQMPTDSMQEWLKRQPVVEKKTPEEVRIPAGTMNEWIEKQVKSRLSMPEEVTSEESQLPAENVKAEGETVEAMSNVESTDNSAT